MNDEVLINMINDKFPLEYATMERSLMNYYHLKNRTDKTEEMEILQKKLIEGIHALLYVMSKVLAEELKEDSDVVFEHLCSIHIK